MKGTCNEGHHADEANNLNAGYAISMASLIDRDKAWAKCGKELWIAVVPDNPNKRENGQRDIVISLYEAGYLNLKTP